MTVETPGAGGAPGVVRADWWHRLDGRRFQCDLCPRECRLAPGQRGLCYLRFAGSDGLYLSGYGRSSGIAVDPVEKKPLFHFLPGSSALSFGTIGCNLVCTNCQNWRISRSRSEGLLTQSARPDELAQRAVELACHSIAFTYNEPIISAEYVIDCARTAHASGVHTIVVTNGYINGEARSRLFAHIDAANVDLKSSDEGFYRNVCRAELQPVLETLRWLHRESAVWLEVTTLLIPGSNDTDDGLLRLCDWIMENLGPGTPLHLTGFHPAYRMMDRPATSGEALIHARRLAVGQGLHFVYVGNLPVASAQSTSCSECGQTLIERRGYAINLRSLSPEGTCKLCGTPLPGRFEGGPGWKWGR